MRCSLWIGCRLCLYTTFKGSMCPPHTHIDSFKNSPGTSLVVQWLAVCLTVLGTWIQSLVQEDSTCCRATKSGSKLLKPSCPGAHTPEKEASAMRNCMPTIR